MTIILAKQWQEFNTGDGPKKAKINEIITQVNINTGNISTIMGGSWSPTFEGITVGTSGITLSGNFYMSDVYKRIAIGTPLQSRFGFAQYQTFTDTGTAIYGNLITSTLTGTAPTSYQGLRVYNTFNGSGTLPNNYGIYIVNSAKGGTGAINHSYGLYIEQQTNGSSSNYGIYVVGGNSYFGGNLILGNNLSPSSTGSKDLGTNTLFWGNTYTGQVFLNYGLAGLTPSSQISLSVSSDKLAIWSHYGGLYIGMANGSFAHFYNSASVPFYFANDVANAGSNRPYTSLGQDLGTSSYYWRGIYYQTLHVYSKRESKENIKDMEIDSLDILKQLKPRSYNQKNNEEIHNPDYDPNFTLLFPEKIVIEKTEETITHGFIVEEMYEAFPDAVDLDEKGNPTSIKIMHLFPLIIKSLQEITQRLEIIETKTK